MSRRGNGPGAGTVIALVVVTVLAVGIGLREAFLTPTLYGLTLAQATDVMDGRPWAWIIAWVLFAAAVLGIALRRASVLRRRGHRTAPTAIRGGIWLWGAVAGSWVLVWLAWDFQMLDVLGMDIRTDGAPTVRIAFALSGVVALFIATILSAITAFAKARTERVAVAREQIS